jgi:hypothetical protein
MAVNKDRVPSAPRMPSLAIAQQESLAFIMTAITDSVQNTPAD